MEIYSTNAIDPLAHVPVAADLEQLAECIASAWVGHVSMLLKLVKHLQSDGSNESYFGFVSSTMQPPISMTLFSAPKRPKASIQIWADRFDLPKDGDTSLHYRLQVRRDGSELTRDFRTPDAVEVAKQIRIALGPDRQSSPLP
jgi:hypothetical protein